MAGRVKRTSGGGATGRGRMFARSPTPFGMRGDFTGLRQIHDHAAVRRVPLEHRRRGAVRRRQDRDQPPAIRLLSDVERAHAAGRLGRPRTSAGCVTLAAPRRAPRRRPAAAVRTRWESGPACGRRPARVERDRAAPRRPAPAARRRTPGAATRARRRTPRRPNGGTGGD